MLTAPNPTQAVPPPDPTLLSDAAKQSKIAESVLSQLGLHPDQAGAKSLLDAHLQGPTADPEISSTIAPLISGAEPEVPPTVPISGPNQPKPTEAPAPEAKPAAQVTPSATPVNQPTATQVASDSGNLINLGSTTMPTPASFNKSTTPDLGRTPQDQDELNRLIRTGSGISQIHNPFLRGLATAGDVAERSLFPEVEQFTPGTEGHHDLLLKTQENLINTDLGQQQKKADLAQTTQQTANLSEKNPNELKVWMDQNPGKPISEYWKEKAVGAKKTPQEAAMEYYTTPKEQGGPGMSPAEAYKQVNKDLQAAKPVKPDLEFQQSLAKVLQDGKIDPKVLTDMDSLTKTIDESANLTPEEKASMKSYLATKTTPASAAGIAKTRNQGIMNRSLTPVIDRNTGMLTLINSQEHMNNPQGYIPATQGATSLTKESVFSDMHFNSRMVREAMNNLQNGFDIKQRAQIALAMSSSDPAKAWDAFWHSSVADTLTPDQVDYITALASLNENGMALRSIQGLGQGSDDLRAAIRGVLPGAGTPNKEYGNRQLDIFDGVLQRVESGVPKTGVPKPNFPEVPKTKGPGQADQPAPPPDSVVKSAKEGQYMHNGTDTWQKINGKPVLVTGGSNAAK